MYHFSYTDIQSNNKTTFKNPHVNVIYHVFRNYVKNFDLRYVEKTCTKNF